jgi:putative oxidoreductase
LQLKEEQKENSMERNSGVQQDGSAVENWSAVDVALLVARIIVGVIFVAHGSQKLFGAFGGPGLAGVVGMMGPVGYLVTIGEFFGGLGLIVGILSRFSAASLIVVMLGAIAMVHGKNGFFAPGGFEFPLSLIGLLATILIAGPGRFALSHLLPLPKVAGSQRNVAVLE